MAYSDFQPFAASLTAWQLETILEAIASEQTEQLLIACQRQQSDPALPRLDPKVVHLQQQVYQLQQQLQTLQQQLTTAQQQQQQAEQTARMWQQKCITAARAWRRLL